MPLNAGSLEADVIIRHSDGFTVKLISFTCEISGSACIVSGQWHDSQRRDSECRIVYEDSIDQELTERIKQSLLPLADYYELPMTDLGTDAVEWYEGEERIKRSFYGAGDLLLSRYPELQGRLEELMGLIDYHHKKVEAASNRPLERAR